MVNQTTKCEIFIRPGSLSHGIFARGDPMKFPFPRLLMQLGLFNIVSGIFHLFLAPFKLPTIISQILGGILLGPSLLGQNEDFKKYMFPAGSGQMVLNTYQVISFILYIFLVGVRTDISMIKNASRLALLIGLSAFFVPMIFITLFVLFFRTQIDMESDLKNALPVIALLEARTSFHIISNLLSDLKLLNSELGRLALSSSIVTDILGLIFFVLAISIKESEQFGSKYTFLMGLISQIFMILVIMFVFRPIMFWMIKQTPEGKPLKETHICAIFLMVFGLSLYGEVTGLHFIIGPLIFGYAVPDGPPMGTTLMEKFGCFLSVVLVPCLIITLSFEFHVKVINFSTVLIVVLVILVAMLLKLAATMVPSLYFQIPLSDALSLGLILNFEGLIDLENYYRAFYVNLINAESFAIIVIMLMVRAGVISQLVNALYDPSRRYMAYRRHTIQHSKRDAELRILACFHQQEDVHSIINLLEVTNPTRESPVALYVLNLVELCGRYSPIFIAHQFDQKQRSSSAISTRMVPIINTFRIYQLHNQGMVAIQCFTAVSPYVTMHDDICTLALEKSANLVIIAFQPSSSLAIRTVNKNILKVAPCSVGILIDGGKMRDKSSLTTCIFDMHVCVIFLEGPDDREALAYAARMAEHPNVKLTVIRIHCLLGSNNDGSGNNNLVERRLDMNAVNELRASTIGNDRIVYKEEGVVEAMGTAEVMKSLNNDFDLIVVGRRHDDRSPMLMGLAEWNEIEELGVIGDMLVSSDMHIVKKASVLVVQQQASVIEEMVDSPRFISRQLNFV